MYRRGLRIFSFAGWILLATSGLLPAMTVKPVNLAELATFAGSVFYGRCLSRSTEVGGEGRFAVDKYRFQVLEALKGTTDGEVVEIRQISSDREAGGMAIPGIPEYEKGQRVLLFLHDESRLGLTSPVGMGQGTFHPRKLEDGEIGFVNDYGNSNLAFQMSRETMDAARLTPAESALLEEARPLRLGEVRELIRKLEDEVNTGAER